MRERDYLRKRAEIEAHCQRDLEALDRVWAMFHTEAPPQKVVSKRRTSAIADLSGNQEDKSFGKRDTVRVALQGLSGEFMTKNVRAVLDERFPDRSPAITENQLSSILARLAKRGEIDVVRPKSGRMAAIYATKSIDEVEVS